MSSTDGVGGITGASCGRITFVLMWNTCFELKCCSLLLNSGFTDNAPCGYFWFEENDELLLFAADPWPL